MRGTLAIFPRLVMILHSAENVSGSYERFGFRTKNYSL